MSKKLKKNKRDRYDGYYLSKLDSMHVIMPYLMPNRTDNEAVMKETVNMTKVLEYIEQKNSENPKYKYTPFHVIMAALAKAIYLRPKMNYFVANKKMYERKEISFTFVAKNKFSDDAGESILIFKLDKDSKVSPLTQVHDFVCSKVYEIRKESKVDDTTDVMNILQKLPGFVLNFICNTLIYLNERGKSPKAIRKIDPYSSTVFISNLGSIKMSADYHHLSNWGTNSVFVIIGEINNKIFADDEGKIYSAPALDLGITVDERIADGVYFCNTIKIVRKLLENPHLLDEELSFPIE